MTCAEMLNIAVLFLQVALIWGQLRLSKKIDRESLKKEKGYFLIEKTNYRNRYDDLRFLNIFDKKTSIGFYVTGNSDVIVKKFIYTVDGKEYENKDVGDLYYTLDARVQKLYLDLNLEEADYKKDQLDVVLRLELENPSGYEYVEVTTMELVTDKTGADSWALNKYNIRFEDRKR